MLDVKRWTTQWGGRELTIEVGQFALQATAACTVQYGDTVVLATAVKSDTKREGIDYFPLMVDFEEKLYAAGKIKGSRFIKREGRPTDEAILSGRMIDRSIRPLFDECMRNDIQVVLTVLSYDQENDAAITALVAASCALSMSPIPWNGPIGGARIGMDAQGEFILNVTKSQLAENGGLDMVVAGTPEKLVMVEAAAHELPETKACEAMKWGCEQLKPVIELIEKVVIEVGQEKELPPEVADDAEEIEDSVEEQVRKAVRRFVFDSAETMIFDTKKVGKKERNLMQSSVKKAAKAHLIEKGFEEDVHGVGLGNIKEYISEVVTQRILEKEQRLDGRAMTEVRELIASVDLLPRTHGSGMFMRGDTQVLSVVTLGSPGDVQTLDTMEEDGKKRYMHHYNDAPFTYGEAGFMRGPGRRAIGHGALAEKALEPVLPTEEDFPYAIRVVSEVMGANGSSSMASTCGSSLSLMAAGVPIKRPVAGIAMGLASVGLGMESESPKWKVLTDLQDVEDGPGGMDFKIAGTADGITAIQMDTKTYGLPWDLVDETVKRSKDARTFVLEAMTRILSAPRAELSKYAPRIETMQIDPEKIRDVIGPGGKMINSIINETGVQMDIEQDGRVLITSTDSEGMRRAIEIVKNLTKEVEVDEIYDGEVVRLEDFGAFVQLLPNKDGLVHVSEIAWARTNKPSDVLKLGQKVRVKVKEIDNLGRVNLSMKALIEKPADYVEQPPRAPRGPSRGPSRGPGGHGGNRGPRRNSGGSHGSRQYDREPFTPRPAAPAPDSVAKIEERPKKKGLFGFGKK
ncbi:MAG: polyribonucleotide nucleotidyltransferase [Candidatus Magasanikbacteria bacterium]